MEVVAKSTQQQHKHVGSLEKLEEIIRMLNDEIQAMKHKPVEDDIPPKVGHELMILADDYAMPVRESLGTQTIQILSDALPKIIPYVINDHQQDLLPLVMCVIEYHPDRNTRDSLTRIFFNLIERPNELQRRIIMDACVTLARNVGELRTETELLPQFWEINHMYEEQRLLVAQSCWELAQFVRPEIRDSLILSTLQKLIEDSAVVVREAAVCNLALVLPLFPNTNNYFKVEEVLFQLISDPSGVVVETTIRKLLHALLKWGGQLEHILQVLLLKMLSNIESCPHLSGVEDSTESHFHALGERERRTLDVLLQLLLELLPVVHQKSVETCPYPSFLDSPGKSYPLPLLQKLAEALVDWPILGWLHDGWAIFGWLHDDCFPYLIRIASLLPQKEDNLRKKISNFLLEVCKLFGDEYVTHIMLPVFLVAVGDDADFSCFSSTTRSKVEALRPKTALEERIASACVLPVLLAGVLGSSSKLEDLKEYLRNLLVHGVKHDSQLMHNVGVLNSVRFLCVFQIHNDLIYDIIREMVGSRNMNVKIKAAKLIRVIVPYIDAKAVSTHILSALVALGSEPNLDAIFASIEAFGTVAQNFNNDAIVDKLRIQMDAFLGDGSQKIMVAVIRALVKAVPHTTESLKNYSLSKICHLSATQLQLPSSNIIRRRDRFNAFYEAVLALEATELSADSVQKMLLPTVRNLLKERDALDPSQKEVLKIILKDRSRGISNTLSKVTGFLLLSLLAMFIQRYYRHLERYHQI